MLSMRCGLGSICLSVLLAYIPHPGLAQNQPGGSTLPLFKIDTSFVWVPAFFETAEGHAVSSIEVSRVRLWDNGAPQKLSQIRTAGLPVSLVILMQTGGSAGRYLPSYADLPSLLEDLLGDSVHEITLITFDSRIEQIWHFPDRSDGVNYALTHQTAGDQGAAIKDALAFGIRQLQAEPGRYRRIVLLLSQGVDTDRSSSPQTLLEQLGSVSTVVYSLSFPSRRVNAKRFSPGKRHKQLESASQKLDAVLQSLDMLPADEAASLTGGYALQFNDQRSFNSGLLAIAKHVRDGYTFGFQPVPEVPGLHILNLDVTTPGVTITARKAYWSKSGK